MAQQPQQVVMMQRPPGIPGVPPGLEYLTQIDQLLVHQQVSILEALTSWECKNKFVIKNSLGQQVYFAAEESDTCHRICCGRQRGFVVHIVDNMGVEVMKIDRPFKYCAGGNCCAGTDCCAQECTIEAPPGQVVGYIKQTCSFLAPEFSVMDASNNPVLMIRGPVCQCHPCCGDIVFEVLSLQGEQLVGKISKQWSGALREMFTDADNFNISFPMDLDVKMKATLMGALFLIDIMFFERDGNNG